MSTFTKTIFASAVVLVCWTSVAGAQSFGGSHCSAGNSHSAGSYHLSGNSKSKGIRFGHHRHPVYYGYRWNGARYGHYSHHGFADLVRSQAQANFVNAQARTQNEITRSARMDNSIKLLETYRQHRSINSEARFSHLWERGERARLEKAVAAQTSQLVGLTPSDDYRLDQTQLNPVSGRLAWPLLLQRGHFDRARKPVDQIFQTRAQTGQINPDHYLPLLKWIEKVDADLDAEVNEYPVAAYVEAKDFLRRIVNEAGLPTINTGMQFATK